jgi:hypothetical protein
MPKITRVDGGEGSSTTTRYASSDENKGKAKSQRLFAILSWIVAIGFEIGAIVLLKRPPVNTTMLIVLIAADLVFAVVGSLLWKNANKLDPASEQNKAKFFLQNQLGVIISVIAFLPLVILIFTDKNLDKKQKSLVGVIAVIALLISGITGVDFNNPSVEKYAQQTEQVKSLNNGLNHVYWTKSGHSYHLYSDCSYINTNRTSEIFEGTVAQARELKNITDLCDRCAGRAAKEKGLDVKKPAGGK